MGGFGSMVGDAIGELGEQVFKNFKGFLTDEGSSYGLGRSGEALLRKSKAGNILADYLPELEQGVRRTGQHLLDTKLQPGMTPTQGQAVLRTMTRDAWNINRPLYFGKNNEFLIKAIAAGTKERGSDYGNAMADVMSVYLKDAGSHWRSKKIVFAPGVKLSLEDVGIRRNAPYVAPKDAERALTRATSWMFTQMIALPHLSQFGNTALREGIGNTAKAFSEWTEALARTGRPDKAFRDVIGSGALYDEFIHEALADAKTPGASLATKLFNHPGFNWVRRQQITISALAAKYNLLEKAAELQKGINIQGNEYVLNKMGVDVAVLRSRGWNVTPEDIQKAMYTGAAETMFLRSEIKLPWRWDENFYGRLASQYRQFGFRQTKFLWETIFKDAYKSGGTTELAKRIATLGILFPVAGEFVKQLEDVARGKGLSNPLNADSYTAEYFDAMAHAAGWGIFSSMFRSAQRGYVRGALEGPIAGTAEDFWQAGVDIKDGLKYEYEDEQDKAETKFKQAGRLTIGKMGIPGRIIANTLLKKDEP